MKGTLLPVDIVELMEFRIQQEELSSRLYDQMRMWFDDKGYINFAKLYESYVADELTHAGWAKSFLLDYGYTPKLKALPVPDSEYESCLDILEATLQHELIITQQVNDLAAKSLEKKMFVLHALGLKYCAEQQEEISKSITLLDVAKLTTDMLVLDAYVGENVIK